MDVKESAGYTDLFHLDHAELQEARTAAVHDELEPEDDLRLPWGRRYKSVREYEWKEAKHK